ncbi:hypothetical protein PCCS19_23070 [Paenibacillus sp. CCS19]|nr:hypothetical protein PCCS19_23070 [Paenibacillus cellulosilyticus]
MFLDAALTELKHINDIMTSNSTATFDLILTFPDNKPITNLPSFSIFFEHM